MISIIVNNILNIISNNHKMKFVNKKNNKIDTIIITEATNAEFIISINSF